MRKTCIALNISIILMEIIGFILNFCESGRVAVEFYTEQSNILALISSSIFLFFLLTKKATPKWVVWLKYISTLGLAVTFLVTVTILTPMYEFRYDYLLFHNALLFQHTLCPIAGVICFVFFDKIEKLSLKDVFISLVWTIFYAALMIILNILGVIRGPYPFLRVMEQPVLVSIIWVIVIFGMAFLLSSGIRWSKNRVLNKAKSKTQKNGG